MEGKIILVDGHSILNRAFYGIPDLTNSEGLHTNAVYGFLNILFKVMEEEQAQYLAVAFDLKAPTFRHKIYEAYKGTRKPMPEELRQQVPVMKEVLQAMNIPLMMLEGYEADDLIGTASRQAQEAGLEVCVLSGDRDLLQLSSDHACIRIPKTKRTGTEIEDYYPADVVEKYGVTPGQIVDLKALMGDASDNIPGIPGVGEKTASKIITEYGSIENAYAHVDEIRPNKAQTSLREHYDLAVLSKTLAAINQESPITLDLEEARLHDLFTAKAQEWFRRLEFKQFLSKFDNTLSSEEADVYRTADLGTAGEFLDKAAGKTVGAAFLHDEQVGRAPLLGMALSCGGETVFLPGDENGVQDILAALCRKAGRIAVVNVKNALPYFDGFSAPPFFDCEVAAYLLNPLKGKYPYDEIAREYAGLSMPAREELIGKKTVSDVFENDRDKACLYAACRALAAGSSASAQLEKLEAVNMLSLFEEVEMPLVGTLFDMEQAGIEVRGQELKEYGEKLSGRIHELEKSIYEQAGETFNINSPKQLGVILFEKMKMPYGKKTKTGYSTAADVLEKLAEEQPVVQDILEYRQLTKLKSTYADGLSAFIGQDGRIHGQFNQTITATGRLSSTDPNLQNIPVRTELGRELRKVFVPKEGCIFVDADYSQIELRVLAHCSGDEKLIEAYREAQDIHAITAASVFHVPLDQVTPLMRRNAKAVNFGIVYGISSFGLSQGLSITRKEAQTYIEKYFETYPGIKHFLDECVSRAREKGYSVTLFGRRRPVPELKSSNFAQRSFGERVAMNAPIQGTAADIIKIAMIRVHERLKKEAVKARLVLQVHDELLVEAEESEQEKVEKILREEMMHAADLRVALEIDMHTGKSWYEAK